MKWLADNYKWLFDGIGALVIIGVVGYLLRRFMCAAEPAYHLEQPRQEKTNDSAELRAEDSHDLRHHAITALLENPSVSLDTAETLAGTFHATCKALLPRRAGIND